MSEYKVGDFILTNDPASEGRVYEIMVASGEHYKIQSKIGYRYCKEWRIERKATPKEIEQGVRDE